MSILLTGATGYIGSHTAVELLNSGFDIVVADNLYNSSFDVIEKIEKITGKSPEFYNIDVTDKDSLEKIFIENTISAVMHFAGYKAVGESVNKPLMYYRNNLDSTISLLEVMKRYNCKQFIFSSSATVYGEKNKAPFTEDMPAGTCTNPYGSTKFMIEQILQDVAKADKDFSVVLLRYFNPIGAHKSGLIGEKPNGIPNNLMPYIAQVAAKIRPHLNVYGSDYDTVDGTGVRDYIHVVDLAKGHLCALKYAQNHTGCEIFNLGTGHGYSVLQVVKAFEKANNIKIPYVIAPRRSGDIATAFADASKAKKLLNWQAELEIEDMCKDSWNFQKNQGK